MDYLDMIAKLGIGNAHPGGFAATLEQLERFPLLPNSKILEVGCGTGRSACYLAIQGHEVTGIDIRSDVIAKARNRAEKENISVRFLEGDAGSLPFPDESFDVIMIESVSIFTDTAKALTEYNRVLRRGGKIFDREMTQRKQMPAEIYNEIIHFYQIEKLWDFNDWLTLLRTAGFHELQIEGPFLFPSTNEDLSKYPDHFQQIDEGSFLDFSIGEVISKYNSIMDQYKDYIGYILMIGTKSKD